ncbi:hypothetical protein BHM03_00014662 [Ensete ventricosum]|nr:hypothetical protein BHM03_00014662 [Ensete ventricosum]
MSISSNTLFTLLSVTFSPTFSFDVLVEATVDAASPRILLNLQSSALAATRPFGSQLLSAAVVEYTTYCLLRSLVEHSYINPKSLAFGYLDEKPIDIGLMKFLGLCTPPPPRPLLRPMLSLHESKGSMTPRKSRLCGTMVLPSHSPTIPLLAVALFTEVELPAAPDHSHDHVPLHGTHCCLRTYPFHLEEKVLMLDGAEFQSRPGMGTNTLSSMYKPLHEYRSLRVSNFSHLCELCTTLSVIA